MDQSNTKDYRGEDKPKKAITGALEQPYPSTPCPQKASSDQTPCPGRSKWRRRRDFAAKAERRLYAYAPTTVLGEHSVGVEETDEIRNIIIEHCS